MAKKLIFIKLGGSVITDVHESGRARLDSIRRLANEIRLAARGNDVVIGHGAGSFAHVPAHKYGVNLGLVNRNSTIGASITQLSAARLHSIMMEQIIRAKIEAFSFSPSSSALAYLKSIRSWDVKPMQQAMSEGFVPVVYGDVAIDTKQGVCIVSTEEVFRYLARKLRPDRIIIGTDVDGVFSGDPKSVKGARLIHRITRENLRSVIFSSESRRFNVTGSMQSKVELLYSMSKKSAALCQIVNANTPGNVYKAMLGRKVTSTIIEA